MYIIYFYKKYTNDAMQNRRSNNNEERIWTIHTMQDFVCGNVKHILKEKKCSHSVS